MASISLPHCKCYPRKSSLQTRTSWDANPSVEYAKRIADALGVSLDYLVSDNDNEEAIDNDTLKRMRDIQKLPDQEKTKVFEVIDALVRDYKTKQAYS